MFADSSDWAENGSDFIGVWRFNRSGFY